VVGRCRDRGWTLLPSVTCRFRGARHGIAWRVAEHDLPAGVVGGRAEQSRVVRVAAHDPVQDDDVSRLNLGGSDGYWPLGSGEGG
jgi:hypothetical protein